MNEFQRVLYAHLTQNDDCLNFWYELDISPFNPVIFFLEHAATISITHSRIVKRMTSRELKKVVKQYEKLINHVNDRY